MDYVGRPYIVNPSPQGVLVTSTLWGLETDEAAQ